MWLAIGDHGQVLRAEDMPDHNEELASVDVAFPRLPADSAASCPVSIRSILRYLADEVPGGEALVEGDLRFRRTALVEATSYWIWSFVEPVNGEPAYLTVSIAPDGGSCVGYERDYYGLSPEQFVLGDYHQVF